MNVYENAQSLSEYLIFHYGTDAQILPYGVGPSAALGFPVRSVRNLIAGRGDQAYDLGCAVGRSTFELTHYARNVQGFDLSTAFISAAKSLLEHGHHETSMLIEGEIRETIDVRAPKIAADSSIGFHVGDAVDLAKSLPPADIVLAANLLCRLPTPGEFLLSMQRLIKPGGQLILVTPFTWLDTFTPREAWPRDDQGKAIPGAVWIKEVLGSNFDLEHAEDLPFLIREHARKFQWSVSLGMRWRRRL